MNDITNNTFQRIGGYIITCVLVLSSGHLQGTYSFELNLPDHKSVSEDIAFLYDAAAQAELQGLDSIARRLRDEAGVRHTLHKSISKKKQPQEKTIKKMLMLAIVIPVIALLWKTVYIVYSPRTAQLLQNVGNDLAEMKEDTHRTLEIIAETCEDARKAGHEFKQAAQEREKAVIELIQQVPDNARNWGREISNHVEQKAEQVGDSLFRKFRREAGTVLRRAAKRGGQAAAVVVPTVGAAILAGYFL